MVHDEKANVAVERCVRELAGTVVVNDPCYFVGKRAEAENVGNGVVVDVIDDVESWVCVGDVILVVSRGLVEAGH